MDESILIKLSILFISAGSTVVFPAENVCSKGGFTKNDPRDPFPMVAAGLIAFLWYALSHGSHPGKVVLNIIPLILLFAVAWKLRKRRPALYYLGVVDGLMLAKAVCGTVAILYF